MTMIERKSVWAAAAARGFIAVIGTVCALGILLRLFVPAVVEEAGPWVGLGVWATGGLVGIVVGIRFVRRPGR